MEYRNYGVPHANPENKEEELAFIGEKRSLGKAIITKESSGGTSGPVQSVEVSYRLGHYSLWLAGLSSGGEKFSSYCWIVK